METRIREIRAERGWTVRRLAEASGVDKNTISEVERGLRTPNPITMHKLARALVVEVRELFPLGQALPLNFDASDLETVEEVDALARQLRAGAGQSVEVGEAARWPGASGTLKAIDIRLNELQERRQELARPLATITERLDKPTEIIFHREPTPEEKARLRAEYPDAVEVEARETVLVW